MKDEADEEYYDEGDSGEDEPDDDAKDDEV
ncbi:MAG: hypothetical protein QS99_C0009G0009 [archaeon GW2011_AR4]|nr:MAG: hypothetical protein QS99_C0009G0009 [archaeon GW2011_AR4]